MIDTTKLLPRSSRKNSVLSETTIVNISIIKKDVKRVDNLLKNKLILSKERNRILKRQQQQLLRRQKEEELESRKDEGNISGDIVRDQKKKKGGLGGLFFAVFAGLIGGIGLLIFKAVPILKAIGRTLTSIARPFIRLFGAIGNLIGSIIGRVKPDVDGLKKVQDDKKPDIDRLPGLLETVGNDLQLLAGALVANSIMGMIFQGAGAAKTTKALNAARSTRLMTPVQVNAVQKAMKESAVAQTVQGPATTLERLTSGRKINKVRVTGLVKEVADSVKKESVSVFDEVVESTVNSSGVRRRLGKDFNKGVKTYLDLMKEQGSFYDPLAGRKITKRSTAEAVVNSDSFKFSKAQAKLAQGGVRFGDIFASAGLPYYGGAEFLRGVRGGTGDFGDFMVRIADTPFFRSNPDLVAKLANDINLYNSATFPSVKNRRFNIILQSLKSGGVDPVDIQRVSQMLRFSAIKPIPRSVLPFGVEGGQIGPAPAPVRSLQDLPDAGKQARQILNAKRVAAETAQTTTKTATRGITKGFTKQFLRQNLGAVPLLGDLAVLLLDIYVFKEIPARAGFKTIGSILGSIIGGILGSLVPGPGTIVGAIVGGIGGDILGGVLFDFLERRTDHTLVSPDPGGISGSDVTRATLSGTTKGLTVKDNAGVIGKGKFVNKGRPEFLLDHDTFMSLEKGNPGLLSRLNASEGDDAYDVLMEETSYEMSNRIKTRVIVVPTSQPNRNNDQDGEIIMVNRTEPNNFLALVTQSNYER